MHHHQVATGSPDNCFQISARCSSAINARAAPVQSGLTRASRGFRDLRTRVGGLGFRFRV